jgi:hypothetical protein
MSAPMVSIASSMICAARLRVMTVQTTTPTSTRSESGDAQQKFSLWQDVADENFCPMATLFVRNEHLHVPPQFNCFQVKYIYIVVINSLNPRCRTHPTLQYAHIYIRMGVRLVRLLYWNPPPPPAAAAAAAGIIKLLCQETEFLGRRRWRCIDRLQPDACTQNINLKPRIGSSGMAASCRLCRSLQKPHEF